MSSVQNYKAPRRALRKALPAAESPHPETTRERLAHVLLLGYKRGLSPLLHAGAFTQCKHLPTCSEYAFVAVVRHGWARGSWLALRRLGRCHPFSKGGYDPVP